MAKKITEDEVLGKARLTGENISRAYKNGWRWFISVTCSCGNKYEVALTNFIGKNSRCKLCYHKKISRRCQKDQLNLLRDIKEKHNIDSWHMLNSAWCIYSLAYT